VSDPAERVHETPPAVAQPRWLLRLYVAGQSPKSLLAMVNLRRLCGEHLAGDYAIEVVDLIEHPHLAARDQVLAIPTLVRMQPPPLRKLVGDLSETERVVASLELPSEDPEGGHERSR
jgi:circadian clock protein KaiB